jgi:hypothetical protein
MTSIDISVMRAIYNEIVSGRGIDNITHSVIVREALRNYGAVNSFQLIEANQKSFEILNMFWNFPQDQVIKYIQDKINKSKYELEIKIV